MLHTQKIGPSSSMTNIYMEYYLRSTIWSRNHQLFASILSRKVSWKLWQILEYLVTDPIYYIMSEDFIYNELNILNVD